MSIPRRTVGMLMSCKWWVRRHAKERMYLNQRMEILYSNGELLRKKRSTTRIIRRQWLVPWPCLLPRVNTVNHPISDISSDDRVSLVLDIVKNRDMTHERRFPRRNRVRNLNPNTRNQQSLKRHRRRRQVRAIVGSKVAKKRRRKAKVTMKNEIHPSPNRRKARKTRRSLLRRRKANQRRNQVQQGPKSKRQPPITTAFMACRIFRQTKKQNLRLFLHQRREESRKKSKAEQPAETTAEKEIYVSPKEQDTNQNKLCDTTITNTVERRVNKSKNYRQKLSSTDGEILEKVEDDARWDWLQRCGFLSLHLCHSSCSYSRPTDDHAQHSELNDDDDNPDYDDECRSEGDVFIEDNSVKSITQIPSPHQQQQQPSANVSAPHPKVPSVERHPSDRRWHWSKESGGLIDKGNRKKKSNGLVRHDSTQEDSNHEYIEQDTFASELPATTTSPSHAIYKKSPLRIATITEANSEQCEAQPSTVPVLYVRKASISKDHEQPAQDVPEKASVTDDFFDNGPHTNPEETLAKLTASAWMRKNELRMRNDLVFFEKYSLLEFTWNRMSPKKTKWSLPVSVQFERAQERFSYEDVRLQHEGTLLLVLELWLSRPDGADERLDECVLSDRCAIVRQLKRKASMHLSLAVHWRVETLLFWSMMFFRS